MKDVEDGVRLRISGRFACADSGINYEIGDLWVCLESSGGIIVEEVRSGAQIRITSSLRGGLEIATSDQMEPSKLGATTELRVYSC